MMQIDPKGVRIAPATLERMLHERDEGVHSAALLKVAIQHALQELGQPHEATPAPVVNAHRILREALLQ